MLWQPRSENRSCSGSGFGGRRARQASKGPPAVGRDELGSAVSSGGGVRARPTDRGAVQMLSCACQQIRSAGLSVDPCGAAS